MKALVGGKQYNTRAIRIYTYGQEDDRARVCVALAWLCFTLHFGMN